MELKAQAAEGQLLQWIQRNALEAMERKATRIDEDAPELHLAVYRQVLLMQIDNYWRKHLKQMNFLRRGPCLCLRFQGHVTGATRS